MFDAVLVARFWDRFAARAARIREALAGGPDADMAIRMLGARARAIDPVLRLEFCLAPAGYGELIVTVDGDCDRFDAVRAFVAAAPSLPGWRLHALRPRRHLPQSQAGLRFAYALANDRVVVAVLTDTPDTASRGYARALVGALLGEDDFARFVSAVSFIDYERWLAVTPGGRSWPLRELPERFDAIFHRPQPMALAARFAA